MKPMTPVVPGLELPEVLYGSGQPEYMSLPGYRCEDGTVLSRWRLSWLERLRVLWSGDLYHWQMMFGSKLQPVSLAVERPKVGP